MVDDRWLSVDEIAEYLGVKRATIYSWVHLSKIPSHKVGRLLKFKRSEIDKWVKSGKAGRQ